jgi:hypothetical protein
MTTIEKRRARAIHPHDVLVSLFAQLRRMIEHLMCDCRQRRRDRGKLVVHIILYANVRAFFSRAIQRNLGVQLTL